MSENLVSDYAVRLATLGAMGGDTTAQYKSVYEIDKEILRLTQEGGGGISEAPEDGSIYGRKDGDWTKVVAESGLQPVIVDELPTTGESGKMYFVPNDDPGVQDNYKEYIWVNNAWECVGNANVDLTDYATKEFVNSSLGNYYTKSDIDNKGYAKVVNLTQAEYNALAEKDTNTIYNITDAPAIASQSWVEDKGYATQSWVNSSLGSYAKKTEIPDTSSFITMSDVEAKGYTTALALDIDNYTIEQHEALNALINAGLDGKLITVKYGSAVHPVESIYRNSLAKITIQWTDWKDRMCAYLFNDHTTEVFTFSRVESSTISNIVSLTQAEYDALETKDASTFYIITD